MLFLSASARTSCLFATGVSWMDQHVSFLFLFFVFFVVVVVVDNFLVMGGWMGEHFFVELSLPKFMPGMVFVRTGLVGFFAYVYT